MKAPRVEARMVNPGDHILTPYKPRTWQVVTEVVIQGGLSRPVRIDTATDRTWWGKYDKVPVKRGAVDPAGEG